MGSEWATEVAAGIRRLLLGEIAIDVNDIFNVAFFFFPGFCFFSSTGFQHIWQQQFFAAWNIASEGRIGLVYFVKYL